MLHTLIPRRHSQSNTILSISPHVAEQQVVRLALLARIYNTHTAKLHQMHQIIS